MASIRMTAAAGSYTLTGIQSFYRTTGQQAVIMAAETGAYIAQGLANILAYGKRIQQLLRPKRRALDALQGAPKGRSETPTAPNPARPMRMLCRS